MSFDTKPVPRVVMVTNATAMIEWDEPSLMPSCEGVVFSVSPYQYRIMLHQQGTGMQNNLAENIPVSGWAGLIITCTTSYESQRLKICYRLECNRSRMLDVSFC